jgi:hypothetical protein
VIEPLRKRTLEGEPYTRRSAVEAKLLDLSSLSPKELLIRCEIREQTDPSYVPSECLVYFVRACRDDDSDAHFNRLYSILGNRVLRCLPRPHSSDGKTVYLTKSAIQEKVLEQFIDLLVRDRHTYMEQLDYYEINFASALKRRRLDAQNKVRRDEHRSTVFYEEETGEPTVAVERAAGSFDPFNSSDLADANYRSRLRETIDTLPHEQRQIILMINQGIPIDSKIPGVHTIAKTLGKSEKTIRTYRDKAYAVLRVALEGEDV